ncbi:MAG: WhiB family transcriptional regulator [Bowdeniella nasicola]|nr:WhiB family transcriptional regulator [Bowdeniella nasicola]
MSVNDDQTWAAHAACADDEPDALFVRGAAQREVRTRCFSCRVRMECLIDALESNVTYGVWGGLTERERRALVRQYPEVTNWRAWLETDNDVVAELKAPVAPRIITRLRRRQARRRAATS